MIESRVCSGIWGVGPGSRVELDDSLGWDGVGLGGGGGIQALPCGQSLHI